MRKLPDFTKRSDKKEMMDDFTSEGELIDITLKELKIINKYLGGDKVLFNGLDAILEKSPELNNKEISIADIGCGGGDILKLISKWAASRNVKVLLTGVDLNPDIIRYASDNLKGMTVNLLQADVFSEEFAEEKYDIITSTLFCHHFTDKELIYMFNGFKKQANYAVLINDLHRHWMAYYSIMLLTKFFSRSLMVKNDAPISVLRAFSAKELGKIAEGAGLSNFSIKWFWAFRFQLLAYTK